MNKKLKALTTATVLTTAISSLIPMVGANAAIVEGATYYYTLDGSDPATSSTRKEWTDTSASQTIVAPDTDEESQVTIKVVAVKDGFANSDVVEKTVTFAAKKMLVAPILDPSTAQTFPNRDTDNYFDIKNTEDTGVKYYYTIDGTTPTVDNGTLVNDKAICLNGPNTDTKTTYNLKVVAEKDGEYSSITSLRVTYLAATGSGDGGTGDVDIISNPAISFNKTSPYNRQAGVKALITGKKAGVDYYYTLDGSDPSKSSTKLVNSYIDITAPDTDAADDVCVRIAGFKDGYSDEISATATIGFAEKKQNTFNVTFKDRTYNDIATVEYNAGDPILSKAPSHPTIEGYDFIGWSNEDANVSKNMIVRAMYEKVQSDVKTHSPSEQIILAEEGSGKADQVLITNSWPGTLVRVYTNESSDTPYYDGTVDGAGECLIDVGNLSAQGGSVWVAYDTSTAAETKLVNDVALSKESIEEGMEILVNDIKLAGSSKGFSPRKQVSYPSRAVAQIYSLPIPASRLALTDETTLMVRGVESGETVNVYDKDNKLIGSSLQGRAPMMEIVLSESVDVTNVYVARVTPGRLESPQTELDKTALNDTGVTQTLANVKQQVISAFNSSKFDKDTKVNAIDEIVTNSIAFDSSAITGTVSNFSNVDAHITADVELKNTITNDTLSFTLDKDFVEKNSGTINGSGSENADLTVDQALDVIKSVNPNYFSEATQLNDVLNKIASLLPSRISTDVSDYVNSGSAITFDAKVSDDKAQTTQGAVVYVYDKGSSEEGNPGEGDQTGQTAQEALAIIKEALENGSYSIDTTKADLFDEFKDLIGSDIKVTLAASNNGKGNIDVDVTVIDAKGTKVSENITLVYIYSNVDNILAAIKDRIYDKDYDKTVNADIILRDIDDLINGVDVEITVTDNNLGKITIDIKVVDATNNKAEGSVSIKYATDGGDSGSGDDDVVSDNKVTIDKSGNECVDEVAEKIKIYLDAYTPKNDSEEAVLDSKFQDICNATTDAGVTVDMKDWNKEDSTSNKKGVLQFIVDVFNEAGEKAKVTFDKFIDKLSDGDIGDDVTDADFDKAVKEVQNYLSNLKASNTSRKSVTMDKIAAICDKYNVSCDIEDWVLESSSKSKRGNLSFNVKLVKGENNKTLEYSKDIAKKSSSSSSSSSGSSSSNSSNESSNENNNNSNSGNGSTSPIENVGKPNTSVDSNGNTITNSDITDGKGNSTGNKVSSSGGGSGSFNVGNANDVVGIYKYEGTTGKYIKLPDAFVKDGAYVQFNTEANVEYFIAKVELPFNMVLNEGWNKTEKGTYLVNGLSLVTGWKELNGQWYYMDDTTKARIENNWKQLNGKWYYLGVEGVMQRGWLQDKGNWYYLNPWSGDMATGWKQINQNWYYLHAYNGAMQTGWHQIGAHWFYLYGDGHMASAETIDGYYLNSDGRWV